MNINKIILLYALGELTRDELKKILEGIGFSAVIVCVLLNKADRKRAMFVSLSPSGSLGGGYTVYDVESLEHLLSIIRSPGQADGWEEPESNVTQDDL